MFCHILQMTWEKVENVMNYNNPFRLLLAAAQHTEGAPRSNLKYLNKKE